MDYLVGMKTKRLTVVSIHPFADKYRNTLWECKCRCGNTVLLRSSTLKRDKPEACGNCNDIGKYKKEYIAWDNMHQRCYNTNNPRYADYGGRGITICQRWREDFLNFLDDMGIPTDEKATIERLNNDGNYEPSNCIWTHNRAQQNNKLASGALFRLERTGSTTVTEEL